MARQNRDTKAIDNSVARNRLRSSLFHWMVKHHDFVVERWDGEKIDWVTFCVELTELGLTDLTGKPASEKTARQTWFRARQAVAKKRAKVAEQPPRPVPPSRIDKDWRPANAPPQPSPPSQTPASTAGRSLSLDELKGIRKNTSEDDDDFDPVANKARLRRIIADRSGR
jgi:hypothetical protein